MTPSCTTTISITDNLGANGPLQIKAIPGVARTTSTVVLNTEFEDQPLRPPGT